MPSLQADYLGDLITTTQKELGKLRWTDLATDLQEFVFLPKILKKEKVQFGSGYGIQWNLMYDYAKTAKHVGLLAKDDVLIADSMTTATVPWRHCYTAYAIDEREIAMNREPSKIVDLVRNRRTQGMYALAQELETTGWGAPSSTSDDKTPYGLRYWLTMYGATATGAFAGAATCNNAFTTIAGIDTTSGTGAGPRWKNWNATVTSITKADAIKKMREGAAKTKFQSPVSVDDYNRGDRYVWYVPYHTLAIFEELLEAQNDNLGNDVASKDGQAMFRRNPMAYAPHLDAASTVAGTAYHLILGVNWGVFYPVFLRGEYLAEMNKDAPEQHRAKITFIDLTWNMVCRDRRRLMAFGASALTGVW